MKKITLLVLFSLLSWCSYSQLTLETFGTSGNALPAGWQQIDVAGANQYWEVVTHSFPQTPAYGGSGQVAFLQRENMITGTSEDWLVTPQFTVPENGQLRFMSKLTVLGENSSAYRVMIHTGSTPTDITTYDELINWTELTLNPYPFETEYLEKIVPMPLATIGQPVYLAFVMNGDNGDRWLIDNVKVIEECFPPTNFDVSNIGTDTATLHWDNPAGASQWSIDIVKQVEAPTGTGLSYTGDSPYLATIDSNGDPLVENTVYKYYLKATCDDTGTSEWIGPFFFSTVGLGDNCSAPLIVTALPFYDNDDTVNFGDEYDGVPGEGCGASPFVWYLSGNDAVYEFTPTFTGNVVIELADCDIFTGLFIYDECADIGIECIGGDVNGGDDIVVIPDFAVTAGENYYIVISTETNLTTEYTLTIQRDFCDAPTGLTAGNPTFTSADLSWENPSGASSWEVVVQDPGAGIPPGAGIATSDNTDHTVTEEFNGTALTSATLYEYWVRASCGDGTFSAWAGPYAFGTRICDAADQCTYTFITSDSSNDGWGGQTMTVTQNGVPVGTITHGSGGPQQTTIQVCDGFPLELYWNSGLSNPYDVGISIKNSFGQVIFTHAPGSNSSDSVIFTGEVDCEDQLCLPPTALTVSNIETTTVDLSWDGPATAWEYYIVTAGSPAPTAASNGTPTSNPAIGAQFLAGGTATLQAATNYSYYVRMVCDGGNTAWSGPKNFTTALCDSTDRCDYTFNLLSMWWSGWMGSYMTVIQNGATMAVIGPGFTSGEMQSVTVQLCDDLPFEIFWNSAGGSQEQVGLTVVNSFDQTVYTLPFNSSNVNSTIYHGYNDCDIPACEPPIGLYFQNPTQTTIDIGWDGPATGEWEYYVVNAGDPAPTGTTPGIIATTNPITIAASAPATNYTYYARRICTGASTDHSSWVGPIPINSGVCTAGDQCGFTFEMTSYYGAGGEGNLFTIYQAGVPVATFPDNIYWEGSTYSQVIPLCPNEDFQVYWNPTGLNDYEKSLVIYTPFLETLFTMNYGEWFPGLTVYEGDVSCDPPPCPQPQNLFASNIENTEPEEVTLNWQEMNAATEWAVWVVPYGTTAPLADSVPTFTTTENPVIYGNDEGEDLTSATAYTFYVMALCGDDGHSPVSYPGSFVTGVTNDDCSDAFELPVNLGNTCDEVASGSINHSTPSGIEGSCGTAVIDVWYSFVAASQHMEVSLSNITGNFLPGITVYEGGCGGLTEVHCSGAILRMDDLTVGTTYYVQLSVEGFDPSDISTFNICVRTAQPPITVDATLYTPEELVQEVLLGSQCVEISNVTSISGLDFGPINSIGYFTRNGSNFPFENGIIMATGDIEQAPAGYVHEPVNSEGAIWEDDDDLMQILNENGTFGEMFNATVLEFDFIPITDNLNFNFMLASYEYGFFQCNYSDAFAFILTGPGITGSENLAVIPNTTIPVSVTTIRDDAYNPWCGDANTEYFGNYNFANPVGSGIAYSGNTIVMQATADVIAGESYHIKLVIADFQDTGVNSAIFLDGGSFTPEPIDLGVDRLKETDNAICYGEEVIINSSLEEDIYDFVWYYNDVEIIGETTPSLMVNEEVFPGGGVFKLDANFEGTDCFREGSIKIEFYNDVEADAGEPVDLRICDATGSAEFDLSGNTTLILAGPGITDPSKWTITYHTTQELAESGLEPLPLLYTNTTENAQQVFARIEHVAGCIGYEIFWLYVGDPDTVVDLTDNFSLCAGTAGTITATVSKNGDDITDEATYTWTRNGDPLTDITNNIEITQAGVYEVTATHQNICPVTKSVTVTIVPVPQVDVLPDVLVCESYILPELVSGEYHTEANGGGIALAAGEAISTTQAIYIFAQSDIVSACTAESSFIVTVRSPEFGLGGPYVFCDPADAVVSVNAENFDLAEATYSWTVNGVASGGTGSTIVGTEFGTYEVTVTLNGCAVTHSVEVTESDEMIVTLTDNFSLCTGTSGTVTAIANVSGNDITNEATYTWTRGGEPLADTANSIEVTQAGVYEVTATHENICPVTRSVTVTVVPVPQVDVLPNAFECEAYILPTLDHGAYYTEANGQGVQVSAGEAISTTRTLYIFAQSGTTPNCTAESSFTVTVRLPEFGLGGPYVYCDPTDAIVSINAENFDLAEAAYAWTVNGVVSGGTGSSIEATEFGTYEVTVTLNGCAVTHSVEVTESDIVIPAVITDYCEDNIYMLEVSDVEGSFEPLTASYEWTGPNGFSGFTQAVAATGPGIYNVTVTTADECVGTAAFDVQGTSCFIQRGISPNNDGDNEFFDLAALDVEQLAIFNRYGLEVYGKANYTTEWHGQASNGDELPTGTYFYVIARANGEQLTGWIYINREE
jgi:gliding motility-associated-like protein